MGLLDPYKKGPALSSLFSSSSPTGVDMESYSHEKGDTRKMWVPVWFWPELAGWPPQVLGWLMFPLLPHVAEIYSSTGAFTHQAYKRGSVSLYFS